MRKRGRRTFRRDEGGAALVEFTLAAPLLLLLAAGLAEFGLMLHQQQILNKSVRDAARYAARGQVAFKSCPVSIQPEWPQIVADAKTLALRGSLNGSAPLLLSGLSNVSMVTVADACVAPGALNSPAGGGNNIPTVTVTATAPFAGTGFLNLLGLSNVSLSATHTEMWVGL